MTITICLILMAAAVLCIPGPGEKTPELFGVPVILLLLFVALPIHYVVRQARIWRMIFDALDGAWSFWFRWRTDRPSRRRRPPRKP